MTIGSRDNTIKIVAVRRIDRTVTGIVVVREAPDGLQWALLLAPDFAAHDWTDDAAFSGYAIAKLGFVSIPESMRVSIDLEDPWVAIPLLAK